jgi:hypothetical protein
VYSPLAVSDYDDQNLKPGSTGIDFSSAPYNADGVYTFEAQSNGTGVMGVKVASASQGTIEVYVKRYDQKTS